MNCFHRKHLKNERKQVPLARKLVTLVKICSFFYNWLPLACFSDGFHQEEKPLNKKNQRFLLAGKSVSVEIDVSTRRKKQLLSLNYDLILTKKNTVSAGRKFVCTSRIKYIEKYAFTIRKHGSHFKKYLKKSKKIGVHVQEYGSSLKFGFSQIPLLFFISSRQKTRFHQPK